MILGTNLRMDPYQTTTGPNRFIVLLAGILVGVAAIGSYLLVNDKFLTKKEEPAPQYKVTPVNELTLSLSNPNDGETVSTGTVKISGSTGIPTIVIINGGQEDVIVEASNGTFSADYKLTLGENQVTITAYEPSSGDSRDKVVDLLYLNENLESL